MRLYKIEFNGYKRLAATSCNVDGRLIAFLGPNEAGKSSVLEGLDWLSSGDEELPQRLISRSVDVQSDEWVVKARFSLDEDDLAALSDLDVDGTYREFVASRDRDGTFRTGIYPRLTRKPRPFEVAIETLADCVKMAPNEFTFAESEDGQGNRVDRVQKLLSTPDASWSDEDADLVTSLMGWMDEQAEDDSKSPSMRATLVRALEAVTQARSVALQEHPTETARMRMGRRRPQFVLFGDEDRQLETEYDLADSTVRNEPSRALANLLAVAGTTTDEVWAAHSNGVTHQATLLKRANRRLEARLRRAWRQAELTVHLAMNDDRLQVLVDELDEEGARTSIRERSDGLRTFLALTGFLAAKNVTPSPILLIDEAETHLHLDAQADLVDFLQNSVQASQVIYTTHSPGCLPPDLGTGVRFVEPDPGRRDVSLLRADFWNTSQPGFSPLLFAMGAGAAAFSACRYAVLTEGAADMILLPSLLRTATGETSLPYQVAPGISGFQGNDLSIDEVAARVVYLVDGDAGGRSHKSRLTRLGVSADRIFSLPSGLATEDLLVPKVYLGAVNALIADNGTFIDVTEADLDASVTISRAVGDWCETRGIRTPGKVAIASRLIQDPEALQVTESGAKALRQLHANLEKAFNSIRT